MKNSDKRIDALEEMLSHHEKAIEDLSAQLAGQWQTISTEHPK